MHVYVYKEWTESLTGIRMQVEESWWDGCSGSTLYPGRIAAVSFDDAAGRFFLSSSAGRGERRRNIANEI
jgi:hypothetical protein